MTVWSRHRELVERRGHHHGWRHRRGYVGTGLVHLVNQVDWLSPRRSSNCNRAVERAVGRVRRRRSLAHGCGSSPGAGRELEAAIEAGGGGSPRMRISRSPSTRSTSRETPPARSIRRRGHAGCPLGWRAVVSIDAEVDVALGWLLHNPRRYTEASTPSATRPARRADADVEHVRSMVRAARRGQSANAMTSGRRGHKCAVLGRDGIGPMTTATGDARR